MKSMFRLLERHAEEAVCAAALCLVSICVFLQVVMRYVFHSALPWTEEVAAMGMAWAVYMGAALCVRERFHIRIMAGVLLFPRRIAKWCILLADLSAAAYCVLMLTSSYEYLTVLARYPAHTPSLGINELYPQSILLIGNGLILVRLIQVYVLWLQDGAKDIPGMRAEHEAES